MDIQVRPGRLVEEHRVEVGQAAGDPHLLHACRRVPRDPSARRSTTHRRPAGAPGRVVTRERSGALAGTAREPGPWGGGPPVAPTGNTALPPLPGPGGVVHGTAGSNPWAAPWVPPPPPPKPAPNLSPFPGLNPQVPLVDRAPR